MERKMLKVSAAVIDARRVQESTLEGYERIALSGAVLLVTPASRALLGRYGASLEVAHIMEASEEAPVTFYNGRVELHPGMIPPEEGGVLVVNGRLLIHPGCQEALSRYAGGMVNGKVLCPESLAGLLGRFRINGKLVAYPDDCVLLDPITVVDRTFPLRAREGERYFAERQVVALDSGADWNRLTEKGVGFVTPSLLVGEDLAEGAIPLFDRRCKVTVLPAGCGYVAGDALLDEVFLSRQGRRAYVAGALTIPAGAGELLTRMEYLHAETLKVAPGLAEAVRGMPQVDCGTLIVVGGKVYADRPRVLLDRAALEGAAEGLSVEDCGRVRFDGDLPVQLIRERVVSIRDCGKVVCSEEQRTVVEELCHDVGRLVTSDGRDAEESGEGPDREGITRISGAVCTL